MNDREIFYIAGLISKYVQGNLSTQEQEALESWRESSSEHQRLLEEFSQYEFLEKKQIAERLCSKNKAYQYFRLRQEKFFHQRKIRLLWVRSIAAMAILLVGVWGIRVYRSLPVTENITAKLFLSAGESRAILTLADGRKMSLGKQISDTLIQKADISFKVSESCIQYSQYTDNQQRIVYNQLDVPRKGEYSLVLSDGTKVWLNAESQLKYPVNFQGNERRVFLKGEAYFEVQRNEQMPFIVEIGTSAVQVLGTSFNVRAYTDEVCCYTTLVEGSVCLSSGQKSLVLNPEEQGIINIISGEIGKREVDVKVYTSWKEGRFVFENQTLEEIMQTLNRWYDVNVFFTSEQVKKAQFIGNLKRYDNFNQILKMLEMTGVAHFKINGNTIIISE